MTFKSLTLKTLAATAVLSLATGAALADTGDFRVTLTGNSRVLANAASTAAKALPVPRQSIVVADNDGGSVEKAEPAHVEKAEPPHVEKAEPAHVEAAEPAGADRD